MAQTAPTTPASAASPAVHKLTSTDAFVVVDLDGAPASGVVRRARKILQSSATDLARSVTYTFATFGVERSGASAGVNVQGDAELVDGAIQAFADELAPTMADRGLQLVAGKGVDPSQLDALTTDGADWSDGSAPPAGSLERLVNGILASATWALGNDLDGKTMAIEADDQAPFGLREALSSAGATVVDVWGVADKPWLVWGAGVDLILAGSRPGILTHQGAASVTAKAIVPWGPIPVTTKAFVMLRRAGVTVVPDFVSTAGFWLGDDAVGRIPTVLDEAASNPDGPLLGACYLAEGFLTTWHDTKPFGRPLAG